MKLLPAILLALSVAAFAEPALPGVKLPPQAREMAPGEVRQFIAAHPDVGILDVRTVEEMTEFGRLPGAKHLDYFHEHFAAEAQKLGLDPAKPCVVYCALGGRAKRAAAVLAQVGFKEIVLPTGGFNAWKRAGLPVEGGKQE